MNDLFDSFNAFNATPCVITLNEVDLPIASGVDADAIEIIYESQDGERISYTARNVIDWEAFRNEGGTVDIRYSAYKNTSNDDYNQWVKIEHESRSGDVVGVIEVVNADTVALYNFRKNTSLYSVDWEGKHHYTV